MDIIKIDTSRDVSLVKKKRKRNNINTNLFSIYKSEKTLKDYMFYLKKFLSFVYEINGKIEQEEMLNMMANVDKEDVEAYVDYLINERNLKKSSINKIIFSLKSVYKELEKHGLPNHFKFIPTMKVARHNFENVLKVSYKEIKKILKSYDIVDDKSYRNYVILYTLFYTGLRSSELLNLKYKNIINHEGEKVLKLEKTKSGKVQYKSLHNDCHKKIIEYKIYIQSLYSISDFNINESFIFPSSFENNKQMTYSNLYKIIKNLGFLINKEVSPHNIRHSVATELSLQGADVLEIRDFLGHSDSKVTEIYINAKNILEKRAVNRLPSLEDD
jgi:integrase/recombinase XerD